MNPADDQAPTAAAPGPVSAPGGPVPAPGRLVLWTIEGGKSLVVEPGPDGLLRLSICTAAGDVANAVLTPGGVDQLAEHVAAAAWRRFEETTAGEFIGKRGKAF